MAISRGSASWPIIVFLFVTIATKINNAQENSRTRPNIVFIMADDLGYNDVGYHNSREMCTPTIDRLAGEGVRLENYYVSPMCSPTRSQFISGRSQIHTGLQHKIIRRTQANGLPLDSPTLADKMRESGYATDMVGKWHLGFYSPDYLPTSRGFETFYGMYLGSGDHFSHQALADPSTLLVDLHNDTERFYGPDFGQSRVYSTDLYTNEAIRVINHRARGDKPFFLFLSYQAVHGPLQVPRRYLEDLENKLGDTFSNMTEKRKQFSAMALAMDNGIERVVTSLHEAGVWNNTILVFSTDNGGMPYFGGSNSPLRGKKGTYYEGGVRGVGFVNSPLLQQKGYVNSELMHVTDWFPTFVVLANGNLNGTRDVNGFNQWGTISQSRSSPREEILYNIDPWTKANRRRNNSYTFDTRMTAALRQGEYKIITGLDNRLGYSLFNVKEDPEERRDLAKVQRYSPKVRDLLDRLQEHQNTAVPVRFPSSQPVTFDRAWGPWVF